MFRSHLHFWEGARFLDYLNRLLPGSEAFIFTLPDPHDRYGLLERFPTHLSFTEDEEALGQLALQKLGVPPGAPFVCFHARDKAYHARWRPGLELFYPVDPKWPNTRNASVHNYLLAAEKLTELGYYAIRMGKYVEEPIRSDNPRIIDYAWSHQSDRMDVYLSAHCAFFIGQISGMTSLPMVFRRPMAFVNAYEMAEYRYCSHLNSVFIPKKFYSGQGGRLLSFREMVELGFKLYHPKFADLKARFDELGMEIQENTPEEIAELVIEVHQRLQGTWAASQEDEELQDRFNTFLRSYPEAIGLEESRSLRIGAHFLRTHPELLEVQERPCLPV
ncbi:MAG: TIGR04372 family glycosyltransferase [Candidatus Omnitrophica bacterium]|nr:TIGR04372 family glycosyltransferase [Candidatus Omnitrophota bacterium]